MRLSTSILFSILMCAFLPQTASSKDWRGIVPLKSTRAEVEKRFGKPDERGGYDLKDERVSFNYGEGPCRGLYLTLGEDNCKCLADDDAVMSISVEPTGTRKISDLKLDMKKFKRTAITPFPQTFEYDNPEEGIVYTVDEEENEIQDITYYPTPADCQDIITKRAPQTRNSWRGLVPLHSNRKHVEALLGSPSRPSTTLVTYQTDHETIVAKYANGNCETSAVDWEVPKDTLIELVVNPDPNFLLKELRLDSARYERSEIFPYPETDNPPRVWNYIDKTNGIRIRTQATSGPAEELVVSITYFPAQRDAKLRCR